MLIAISLISFLGGLALLISLCLIDLKERILPNELVLGFAVCGAIFHTSLGFQYNTLQTMILGAFIGAGILYVIRGAANFFYKEDSLGLGDVKLLAAGGVWLGPEYILIGMSAGALIGFLHGLCIAIYTKKRTQIDFDLGKMSVPAGPGFSAGIILAGLFYFYNLDGFTYFARFLF